MASEDQNTSSFRGASLTGADFTGARLRECDLRRVKIADSWLIDVNVSGGSTTNGLSSRRCAISSSPPTPGPVA